MVRALVEEFQLTNVDVVHARVEDLPNQPRHFDFILGRAVTNLEGFLSWVQPFVRLNDDDDGNDGNDDGQSQAKHDGIRHGDMIQGGTNLRDKGSESDANGSRGSPWGIGRGVLYVKSDDVAAAMVSN